MVPTNHPSSALPTPGNNRGAAVYVTCLPEVHGLGISFARKLLYYCVFNLCEKPTMFLCASAVPCWCCCNHLGIVLCATVCFLDGCHYTKTYLPSASNRDRPELASKPVAVGGDSMISTTNYHARLKGVRSAMPGFIGRKLCPELVSSTTVSVQLKGKTVLASGSAVKAACECRYQSPRQVAPRPAPLRHSDLRL